MRVRTAMVVAAAVLGAACSPGTTSTTATIAATDSTTTSTTTAVAAPPLPPFATAYPGVSVKTSKIDSDAVPFSTNTLEEVRAGADDTALPVVRFTESYVFRRSAVDLIAPGPVVFRNDSDREIVLAFGVDTYDPITLAAGAEAQVDVIEVDNRLLRFHTTVGQARLVGNIEVKEADPVAAELQELLGTMTLIEPTEATDRTGSLHMAEPAAQFWRENRGYQSFVLTPERAAIPQGSLSSALLDGAVPFEAGLRVDASDGDNTDTASARLAGIVPPAGCDEAGNDGVSHPRYPASTRRFECGTWDWHVGYLAAPTGAIYFSFADQDDTLGIARALQSLSVSEPGTYVDLNDAQPWLYTFSSVWVGSEADLELDIVNGRLGPPAVGYTFHFLSDDQVTVRNFDNRAWRVSANGAPLAEIDEGQVIEFSIDDFEHDSVSLSIGDDPWARLDVFLDTAMRRPRQPLPMSSHFTDVELEESIEPLLGNNPVLVPQGWHRSPLVPGFGYRYEREADDTDVAVLQFIGFWFSEFSIADAVIELRSEPTSVLADDRFTVLTWEIPGRPTVSIVYLLAGDGRIDEVSRFAVRLDSAPEEHEVLQNALLFPATEALHSSRMDP